MKRKAEVETGKEYGSTRGPEHGSGAGNQMEVLK